VRRLKNPNLVGFEELGSVADKETVLSCRFPWSLDMSGVAPRVGKRVTGANDEDGLGEERREEGFNGSLDLAFIAGLCANFDSAELLRPCEEVTLTVLPRTTGEGPRSPLTSGVPYLLGMEGRLDADNDTGDSPAR